MATNPTQTDDHALDWIQILRETRDGLMTMLKETEGAFTSHSVERASKALGLLDGINERCEELTERVVGLVQSGGEDAEKRMWCVRIASDIGQLAREVADVTKVVLEKIENRVLFSDKANHELKPLFALVRKAVGDVFDGVETGNQTLLIAVIGTAEKIAEQVNAAATEHEERLVRGICHPKASAVFLDMIYSLRGISHTLKMLVKDVPERDG